MKKTAFLPALLVASVLAVAFTQRPTDTPAPNTATRLQTLSGTYADVKGVDWGRGTYGTRVFTFDKGKWTLLFTLALDPAMKNQVFTFRTTGSYQVLAPSQTLPNTYNALFVEDKKWVTLKTADAQLAQAFGLSQCGFVKDVEKDISVSGCSLWKPVRVCNEDHDLLSLDAAGNLYFGLRPADNDMCTADKRPTKLNVAVVKVPTPQASR